MEKLLPLVSFLLPSQHANGKCQPWEPVGLLLQGCLWAPRCSIPVHLSERRKRKAAEHLWRPRSEQSHSKPQDGKRTTKNSGLAVPMPSQLFVPASPIEAPSWPNTSPAPLLRAAPSPASCSTQELLPTAPGQKRGHSSWQCWGKYSMSRLLLEGRTPQPTSTVN